MRKQLIKSVENILSHDGKATLLLGDIGIFGFRKAFEDYPDRVFNIGILVLFLILGILYYLIYVQYSNTPNNMFVF